MNMVLKSAVLLSVALTLSVTGCQSEPDPATTEATAGGDPAAHDHGEGDHGEAGHDDAGHDDAGHAGHDHSGWWCKEHGVPEGECPRCDTSLLADFKAKDDWCDDHDRPQSHCFICEPELFDKFAARYEARFGESPPQPTE